MKKLFSLLVLVFGLTQAQYLVEDNDVTENAKEIGKLEITFDLKNPLEYYRLKCANATYAQFPGGENAFKQELFKNIKSSLDKEFYTVNGTFDFIFSINKEGGLANFTLKPEIPNGNILFEDLNYAIKKMNKKWIPGTCNGSAVDSKLRLRVDFRTENFDL